MEEIEKLKKKLNEANETVANAKAFHAKMENLHEQGLIKELPDGSVHVIDDPEERMMQREEMSSKKKNIDSSSIPNRRQA